MLLRTHLLSLAVSTVVLVGPRRSRSQVYVRRIFFLFSLKWTTNGCNFDLLVRKSPQLDGAILSLIHLLLFFNFMVALPFGDGWNDEMFYGTVNHYLLRWRSTTQISNLFLSFAWPNMGINNSTARWFMFYFHMRAIRTGIRWNVRLLNRFFVEPFNAWIQMAQRTAGHCHRLLIVEPRSDETMHASLIIWNYRRIFHALRVHSVGSVGQCVALHKFPYRKSLN